MPQTQKKQRSFKSWTHRPSCISGDVSIDSGDGAEFVEQLSKDLIWENRNEPKARLQSSIQSLGSLKGPFQTHFLAYMRTWALNALGLTGMESHLQTGLTLRYPSFFKKQK